MASWLVLGISGSPLFTHLHKNSLRAFWEEWCPLEQSRIGSLERGWFPFPVLPSTHGSSPKYIAMVSASIVEKLLYSRCFLPCLLSLNHITRQSIN